MILTMTGEKVILLILEIDERKNKMEQKCQNIHTNELLTILRVEIVDSYPKSFTVYVLSDGERW